MWTVWLSNEEKSIAFLKKLAERHGILGDYDVYVDEEDILVCFCCYIILS
jgi:hypothetical protein